MEEEAPQILQVEDLMQYGVVVVFEGGDLSPEN